MKKNIFLALCTLSLLASAQEKDTWRIGAQWGFQGNNSHLIGGQQTADARFESHNAGGGALNVFARYDLDKRWMLLAGLGLSSYGFEFSLSQNYSLLNPDSRRATLKNNIGLLELPIMIHYKFNPNCKQVKWLLGAGFAQNLQTGVNTTGTFKEGNEGNANISSFKSDVILKGTFFPVIRFSVGREKVYSGGGILNFSMLFNYGFAQSAKANVAYTIDGNSFQHQFDNKGNFFGLRMAYYFAPVKTSTLK